MSYIFIFVIENIDQLLVEIKHLSTAICSVPIERILVFVIEIIQ